jgi:hypothetical protein
MNSELDENGKDTVVLDWFMPPESKTLRPVWWNYAWKRSPLEWSSRPPYMAGGLGFPFGVRYRFRKVSFRDYREDPAILGPTDGTATVI